jgi:hypothetical protein
MALKFSLTEGQTLRLFVRRPRINLCPVAIILNGAHIMNEVFYVIRLVQGLLAVTIVSGIVLAIQFAMVD